MRGLMACFSSGIRLLGVQTACALVAVTSAVSLQFASSRGHFRAPLSLPSRTLSFLVSSFPQGLSFTANPLQSFIPSASVSKRALLSSKRLSREPAFFAFASQRSLARAAEKTGPTQKPPAMAWRSHGETNKELVENLRRNGVFSDQRVYETLLKVDRGDFSSISPYADSPQPIGFDATISAPHMHAMALEHLKDKLVPGNRALDVGSGTGFLTVCMALMVAVGSEGGGTAVGIDYKQGLVDLARRNVAVSFGWLLEHPNFQLLQGDGWQGGPASAAPYHAIHVGAAAATIPAALLEQLAPGGLMIIPVECRRGRVRVEGQAEQRVLDDVEEWSTGQVLVSVRKETDGSVSVKYITSVMYVPLVKTK